jgi:hypothetical protein
LWTLDEASARQLRKSLGGSQPQNDFTRPPTSISPPAISQNQNPMFADKNVSYAVSGGSVVVATSPAMMNKAIQTLNGQRSLAEDLAFAEMATHVDPKDQCLVMCALSRIAERFSTELTGATKDSGFTPEDVINLFGGPNTGLVGSSHFENNTVTGSLFLPLDFDRMAKLITAAKQKRQPSMMPDMTEGDASSPIQVK